MARKTSKRSRAQAKTKTPDGLAKFIGLLSTSAGLPGRIRIPNEAELEELNKVIASINAGTGVPDIPQQFWNNDAQVDCALAAATFVGAGVAGAVGATPVAAGLAAVAAKALADAVKGANTDCKAGCGMETLEQIASLEAKTLKSATNSISFSGLMAARNILIETVTQQQRARSPRGKSAR
jgi:hypothetical protein